MRRAYYPILLSLLFFAGAGSAGPASHTVKSMERDSLTVVTYNLWHGLNPVGVARFKEYETQAQREARLQGFLLQARTLDPDVLFLQEVNPVLGKAKRIARELGYDHVTQVANAGLKIGPWGPPGNLRSGLAILAKKDLRLKKLRGRKLSGGDGFCSPLLSLQLSEFRYALAAQIQVNGRPILLMNTHLHHGLEVTPEIRQAMDRLVEQGKVTRARADEIITITQQASTRRRSELEKAISLARLYGFEEKAMLFAGDFNATPGAPELEWLIQDLRFRSVTADDDPDTLLITWDAQRNANTQFVADFKPVNAFETFVMEHIKPLVVGMSRRLDYVFYRKAEGFFEVGKAGLFGNEPHQGRMNSDHFGIWARLKILDHRPVDSTP